MRVLIIGAGGHAKVIAEIVRLLDHDLIGFLDDNPDLLDQKIAGSNVLGHIQNFESYSFDQIILGIGNNQIRHKLHHSEFKSFSDEQWFTAIHPKAIISDSVKLGFGVAIMAGATINCDTVIKDHAIINTGSTVDHDCTIENYVHIAPGVNLAGGVSVGVGSLIGIGACAIPYTKIGSWTTVGAGATVMNDIADTVTVVGTPARPLKK